MAKTSIEWTRSEAGTPGYTWNAIRGCSKVSSGCKNCFAERMAARFCGEGQPYHGLIRDGKWSGEVRFIPEMLAAPLHWKKPSLVFVNSMSDLFHESLSFEQIAAVYGVIASCPQHTFQILTKRAERMVEFYEWIRSETAEHGDFIGDTLCSLSSAELADGSDEDHDAKFWKLRNMVDGLKWPLPNVHVGVSVENQAAADERIPYLLRCPAAVRWISAEPLLSGLDIRKYLKPTLVANNGERLQHPDPKVPSTGGTWEWGLDWIVVGTESGPGRRPSDVAWFDSIIDQCKSANVPVFVKQIEVDSGNGKTRVSKDTTECGGWPARLNVRMMPGDKW